MYTDRNQQLTKGYRTRMHLLHLQPSKFLMAYEFWTQIPWGCIVAQACGASNVGMSSETSEEMLFQSKFHQCLHDKSREVHNDLSSKYHEKKLAFSSWQPKNHSYNGNIWHFVFSLEKPYDILFFSSKNHMAFSFFKSSLCMQNCRLYIILNHIETLFDELAWCKTTKSKFSMSGSDQCGIFKCSLLCNPATHQLSVYSLKFHLNKVLQCENYWVDKV
jgi:hypothetical protein